MFLVHWSQLSSFYLLLLIEPRKDVRNLSHHSYFILFKYLKMKETRETLKDHSLHNRREYERHNVGNYPAEVKKPDGTKLNAFLNDISYSGFQVVCTGLTAHILSQKTGLLTENDSQEVEVSIKIPFKEGIEKIVADCNLAYIAKNEDKAKEMSFAVGLQVNNFKGKSVEIINRLFLGQAIAVA